MSQIHLTVEAYGGTSIDDACVDLCALARRIDVNVHCKFNGVTIIARPTSDPVELAANWQEAISSRRSVCTTYAGPRGEV